MLTRTLTETEIGRRWALDFEIHLISAQESVHSVHLVAQVPKRSATTIGLSLAYFSGDEAFQEHGSIMHRNEFCVVLIEGE